MLSRVTHITTLSVVICVVKVWNRSCHSSFPCLSPFCDWSCKFVTMECLVFQFVPSTNISKQFVSILEIVLQLIQVLPVWIHDHPSNDLKLWITVPHSCLQIHSIAQHIFEHVLPSRGTRPSSLREAFPTLVVFSCSSRNTCFKTYFENSSIIVSFGLHSRWVHHKKKHGQETMLVVQDPRVPSISSTWEPYAASFQPLWCHPRTPKRIILVFDAQTNIPNVVLFPIQVPVELPRIGFPTRGQQVDVRTNFVWEDPLGLQCLTKVWATSVVVDVSIRLDLPTSEFCAVWERPPILLGCRRIRHLLLVLRIPVVLKWCPGLLRLSSVMLMILVQWRLRRLQNRLWQCHHGTRLCICIFVVVFPTLCSLYVTFVQQMWQTFCLSLCVSRITSFLLLTFSIFDAVIL